MPRVNSNQISAVDLTLCSPNLAASFTWDVMSDPMGSDHIPILFSSEMFEPNNIIYPSRRWRIDRADWTRFREVLNSEQENTSEPDYKSFIEVLNRACEESIPQNSPHKKKDVGAYWWNNECQMALQEREIAATEYRRRHSRTNFLMYNSKHENYKRTIWKAKKDNWISYCLTLTKSTPIKEIWRKLKQLKNRKTSNSQPIEEGEWIQQLLESCAPPWVPPYMPEEAVGTDIMCSTLQSPFTLLEVESNLKKSTNTAPGTDDIVYPILVNLPIVKKEAMVRLFNEFWTKGS